MPNPYGVFDLWGVAGRRRPTEVSDSGQPAPSAGVSLLMSTSRGQLCLDSLPFDGAIDRRSADAEEHGDLSGAVLTAVHVTPGGLPAGG